MDRELAQLGAMEGVDIAFISTRTEKPQVHVMRLRGGEAYAITDAETGVSAFQWSPKGDRVAYITTDPKGEAEKQREKEKRDVHVVNEEFQYAHLHATEVKPADDSTRQTQRLTGGAFHVTGFDWSPDGSTIAFAHQPDPRINSFMRTEISSVPADSGEVSPLVERPGVDAHWNHPRYSPGGETIAFLSMGGERAWEGLSDVWTVPAEGGEPVPLAHTSNRDVSELIGWTAGGEHVLAVDADRTSAHVFEIPTDRGAVRQVSEGDGLYEAASYSRSADRLAFTYQNSSEPLEVYVTPREIFSRQQISNVSTKTPRPPMGRTELVTWSAPDGTNIDGLLTYPIGYEEGDQVPLVLLIHGGPHGIHNRLFTGAPSHYVLQVFAQTGYAVLRPNPRGSSGYGRDFRSAIVGNWGFGDMGDQMSGVDHLVEIGVTHPDSLAITGGSYGGYMTAFIVTQTDRFEAAAMVAGISNQLSMTGTTDIPVGFVAQMGGEYWNDYADAYEQHSPIYHVEGVSTPTLVIHGSEDARVPPSQGREFFRALDLARCTHAIRAVSRHAAWDTEPKLRMDFTLRVVEWFDEHLGRTSSLTAGAAASEQ